MDLTKLSYLIKNSEDVLVQKVLEYAKKRDYVKYTSTLAEAWRQSIVGLSEEIIKNIEQFNTIAELGPDDDFTQSEIAQFGIMEAKRHRLRGITLSMFLGLMKYYQQAYMDIVDEGDFMPEEKKYFWLYIRRYFDHVEIGFVMEWMGISQENKMTYLQETNRIITNEKNKYLTIFESIYDPIILVDKYNNIENVNSQAAKLFLNNHISGRKYYGNIETETELDWLKQELALFINHNQEEILREKTIETRNGQKTFMIKMKRMLDISEKYSGTVVIFYDITDRLKIEKQLKDQYNELEYYAYIDPMTDVLNRRTGFDKLENEIALLGKSYDSISICFIDIDGLKLVNDTYGHMDGDELIIYIISTLKSFVREKDTISRVGGDEFLVILPDCSELETDQIINKVIKKLKEYDKKEIKPYKHSFSYGIVEMSSNSKININAIIKTADQKMYENKMAKKQKK